MPRRYINSEYGGEMSETPEYVLLKQPVYEWWYSFAPGYMYGVEKGKEPNAFYRFMQRICLGVIWTKTS